MSGAEPKSKRVLNFSKFGLSVLVIGAVFYAARIALASVITSRTVEVAQLFGLPIIILVVLRLGRYRLPKGIPILAMVLGYTAVFLNYTVTGSSELPKMLVSRLADDKDESISRKFRERIDSNVERFDGSIEVSRYPRVIRGRREAREILKGNSETVAVTWGDRRFVNVLLREEAPVSIFTLNSLYSGDRIGRLRIISSVSSFALPFSPIESTAFFLSNFVDGYFSRVGETQSEINQRSARLDKASNYSGHGLNKTHRALAIWKLGTLELLDGLSGDSLSIDRLRCIAARFNTALGMFYTHDNPELYVAISNNLGIIQILLSDISGELFEFAEGRRILGGANAIVRGNGPLKRSLAGGVVVENISLLDGRVIKDRPKVRAKGKKR